MDICFPPGKLPREKELKGMLIHNLVPRALCHRKTLKLIDLDVTQTFIHALKNTICSVFICFFKHNSER